MRERIEPPAPRDEYAGDHDEPAAIRPSIDEPGRTPPPAPPDGRQADRIAADARRRARVRAWVLATAGAGAAPHLDTLVGLAARALRLRTTPWLRAVVAESVAEGTAAAPRSAPEPVSEQPADQVSVRRSRRRSGRQETGSAGSREPTPVRRDPALPEDPPLLPLDLPVIEGAAESLAARAVRTLRARLTAGQIVWVAPAGGAGSLRRWRLFAASPRGYTNISLVAAHALGLDRHLALRGTAITTDRPAAELVAALAQRVGLDGALVCRWT